MLYMYYKYIMDIYDTYIMHWVVYICYYVLGIFWLSFETKRVCPACTLACLCWLNKCIQLYTWLRKSHVPYSIWMRPWMTPGEWKSLDCTQSCTGNYCPSFIRFGEISLTLPHTATHCETLQHTATHCNTLQNSRRKLDNTESLFYSSPHWWVPPSTEEIGG